MYECQPSSVIGAFLYAGGWIQAFSVQDRVMLQTVTYRLVLHHVETYHTYNSICIQEYVTIFIYLSFLQRCNVQVFICFREKYLFYIALINVRILWVNRKCFTDYISISVSLLSCSSICILDLFSMSQLETKLLSSLLCNLAARKLV